MSTSKILDSQVLEIPCERCGRKTKKTVGWVKTNRQFTCGCGTVITLDASDFRRKIAQVERDLAGLLGKLK